MREAERHLAVMCSLCLLCHGSSLQFNTRDIVKKQDWALHHCYRTDIYSIWEAGLSFTSLLLYWHLQYLRSRVELYITVTVLTFTISEKQVWALHHCYCTDIYSIWEAGLSLHHCYHTDIYSIWEAGLSLHHCYCTDIYSIWEAGLSFTSLLPYWHLQYLRSRVELYITVTVLTFTVSEKQGRVYITVTVLTFTVSEKQGWALYHCYRTYIYSIWEAGLSFTSLLPYWHLQYLRSRVELYITVTVLTFTVSEKQGWVYITVTVLTFTVSEKQGWALNHCYRTDIYSIWEAGLSFISLLPNLHLQYLRSRFTLYITVTILTFTVSEKQGSALYHCYHTDIYSVWEAGLSFISVTVLTFTVSEKQGWVYITVTVLTFTVSEKQGRALHHCYRTDIYSIWEAGLSFISLLPYWHLQYLRSRVELYITVTVLTFTVSEKQGSALYHCYHTDIYSIWEAGLSFTSLLPYWHLQYLRSRVELYICYRTGIYSVWEAGLSFISLLPYWYLQYLRSRVELYITVTVLTFTISEKQGWALYLLPYWHLQYLRSRVELYITVTVLTFTVSEKQGWALHHCYHTDIYSIWEAGFSFISLLPYWHLQYLRSRVELYITVTVLTFTISEKQGWALYLLPYWHLQCLRSRVELYICYCTDIYSIWEAGLSFISVTVLTFTVSEKQGWVYITVTVLTFTVSEKQGWVYITVTVLTFTVSEKQGWALYLLPYWHLQCLRSRVELYICYCTDIYSIWEAGLSLHHCYCTDIYSIWEAGLSFISVTVLAFTVSEKQGWALYLLLYWHLQCLRSRVEFTSLLLYWHLQYLRSRVELYICYRTGIYSVWEAGLSFISVTVLTFTVSEKQGWVYITVTVLTFTVSEKQGWALYLLPYWHLQYLRSRVEFTSLLLYWHLQYLRSRVELYICYRTGIYSIWEAGLSLHHCYCTDIYSIWEAGLSFTSLLPYWHLQYLRSRVELYIAVTVLTFTVSEKQGWALYLLPYWHLQCLRSRVELYICYCTDICSIWEAELWDVLFVCSQ